MTDDFNHDANAYKTASREQRIALEAKWGARAAYFKINHVAMDEAAIERAAESQMDRLDRRLRMGTLTQAAYDALVRDLDKWANEMYRRVRR